MTYEPQRHKVYSAIEIPAHSPEKLAMLVRMGFRLMDHADPDVVMGVMPEGWTAQDVSGPGDHRERHGQLVDHRRANRVSLMAREVDCGRLAGKHGPSLTIHPRFTMGFSTRDGDAPGTGRWVITDNQAPWRGEGLPPLPFWEGELINASMSRMMDVHAAVCASVLAESWPRHADPLAYWWR